MKLVHLLWDMGAFAQKGELVYVSKNDSEQNRFFLEFCL